MVIDLEFTECSEEKRMVELTVGVCSHCSKKQPALNLFCVNCKKRNWDITNLIEERLH